MRIIAIASQKGGSGKSTLAAHLAVLAAGEGKTVVVDTDPQGSLSWWFDRRESDTPSLIQDDGRRLVEIMNAALANGVKTLIIDTPPHADSVITKVAKEADLTLVPCRPGPYDLAAISATVDMLQAIGRPLAVVLNACPPRHGNDEVAIVREARAALAAGNIPTFKTALTQRAALSHALIDGRAVTEFDPAGKASAELKAMWREVKGKTHA